MKEKQSLGTPSEIAMLKYVEQIIDVKMTRINHKVRGLSKGGIMEALVAIDQI